MNRKFVPNFNRLDPAPDKGAKNAPPARPPVQAKREYMRVIKVDVVDPGEGYTEPPRVVFQGGSVRGARATASLEFGKIKEITISDGGMYVSEPLVTLDGGGGTGARAKAKIG